MEMASRSYGRTATAVSAGHGTPAPMATGGWCWLSFPPRSTRPPVTLDRLAHEYDLRDDLDSAWAARPLEFLRERGRSMLVLEDPGGEPLERRIGAPMEPGSFLGLAIGICAALRKLHQYGFIHEDIKPANILMNCTDGQVRLTGFGIASRLLRERQSPDPPESIG